MGWLTGWIARKSKHIDGTGNGDLENYRVWALSLHRDTGTDDDTNVYLPYLTPDFRDVRFTTDDGETLIPFYLSGSGDSRVVVVNVPSIPSAGVDVYIYYGNADAEDGSSKSDTYGLGSILYDDFTEDNFTDVGTPYVHVDTEDERLEALAYRVGDERCYRDIGIQGNAWRLDFAFYSTGKSGTYGGQIFFGLWDTLANFRNPNYAGDLICFDYHWTGSSLGAALDTADEGVLTQDTINVGATTLYHVTLIRKSATSVWMGIFSDEGRTTHIAGSPVTETIEATIDGLRYLQASNVDRQNYPTDYIEGWFDDLLLSEYSDPDPAWAATGEEEVTAKTFVGPRIGHNFAGLKVPSLWTPKVFKTSGGRLAKPAQFLNLREHRTATALPGTIVWYYMSAPPAYLDMERTYQGIGGHVFFIANTGYLDGKKIWVDWQDPSGVWWDDVYFLVYDGGYDRSSDTDFPDGAALDNKGSGLIKEVAHKTTGFARTQDEWLCDLGPAQESLVTVTLFRAMQHNVACHLYIYGFQIRDAADNPLVTFSIDPVTMEREATYGDYGYTDTLS